MNKVELLAPAGSLEKLKMAIIYGADAVYMGGEEYGLRAFAENFSFEEMKEELASPKVLICPNSAKPVKAASWAEFNFSDASYVIESPGISTTNSPQTVFARCPIHGTVCYLDGDGVVRRCPFVDRPLGNIYDDDFPQLLPGDVCPNEECRCHIGYAHLERVGFDRLFGDGLLERVPVRKLW
jgi:hypothetical protein